MTSDAVLIESFLEMMSAERGAADNTLESYRRDLDAFREHLGRTSMLKASGTDVTDHLAALTAQGFAASTQARHLSALRQFYRHLYADGLRGGSESKVVTVSPSKGTRDEDGCKEAANDGECMMDLEAGLSA